MAAKRKVLIRHCITNIASLLTNYLLKMLSSALLHHAAWQKFTNVSENRPDDGGSTSETLVNFYQTT
jgi:hypothetical protein